MLPEISTSNLAYDLSRYDTQGSEEKRRQDRERRAGEIKMYKHSVSRSGSKLKLIVCCVMVFAAFCAVNIRNTKKDDLARMVDDQRTLLAEAQDENSLLQSRLDSKVNISYIEEYATTQLGMAKVTQSQINYLGVNTENLIEVDSDDDRGFIGGIADWFGDMMEYIGF